MDTFCQSCGMPMGDQTDLYGTEKNGEKNAEFCKYCYENGEYTFHGTLQEMVEICVKPMVQENPEMTEDAARAMMQQFLPTLKRWRTA